MARRRRVGPFRGGLNPNQTANPIAKGRDSVKIPNQTPGVRKPPRNKRITPSKPNRNNDEANATPKQGKGGGKGGRGLERAARRLTDGVIRDEVLDLRSQRREINRAADTAYDNIETNYNRGLSGLSNLAQQTGGYVAEQNRQSQAGYDIAAAEQNAAAIALQNQLKNVYEAGEGSATAEMARLGLTGAGGASFLGQLNADQAFAQSMGAQASTDNQANLSLAQANSGAVGNLIGSMVQGSYMSGIGQNLMARNDALAETQGEQADQLALVRDAIRDARGTRKDTFFQLLTQLKQTGWANGGGKGKGDDKPKVPGKPGDTPKVPTRPEGSKPIPRKPDGGPKPPKKAPPKKDKPKGKGR